MESSRDMSKAKNGNGHAGSGVFGSPERVLVKRGLAEFRSNRPVIFSAQDGKFQIALPVDRLDAARLHAFEHLCAPAKPKLVVTARRARALGIESNGPVALALPQVGVAEAILSLVEDATSDEAAEVDGPAGSGAAAAIELAKIAQCLPALLIAEVETATSSMIEPPLVIVGSDAVMKFGRADLHSLEIASEAKVPLQGGIATRFVVSRASIGGGSVAIIVGEPDLSKPVPVRLH